MKVDVLVIGAGPSGLFCAWQAGNRGRSVLVAEHSPTAGRKLLMSGGGRCNFTNRSVSSEDYVSGNPHFCKSALCRFTQNDFIRLLDERRIPYEERDMGRLFLTGDASGILCMLLSECRDAGVTISTGLDVRAVRRLPGGGYSVTASDLHIHAESVVVATGGLSIPSSGSGPMGYRIADGFGMKVLPTRPGLAPFTWKPSDSRRFSPLSGISVSARVSWSRGSSLENILFTHRGLSGPAALQASLFWNPAEQVQVNLLPEIDLAVMLAEERQLRPGRRIRTVLSSILPRRLVEALIPTDTGDVILGEASNAVLAETAGLFHSWTFTPGGTEGYGTAEVTVGGVDCRGISSKTMESTSVPGLFFTGEVLDVTGRLGGFNLQWAWSSGWSAGQYA